MSSTCELNKFSSERFTNSERGLMSCPGEEDLIKFSHSRLSNPASGMRACTWELNKFKTRKFTNPASGLISCTSELDKSSSSRFTKLASGLKSCTGLSSWNCLMSLQTCVSVLSTKASTRARKSASVRYSEKSSPRLKRSCLRGSVRQL